MKHWMSHFLVITIFAHPPLLRGSTICGSANFNCSATVRYCDDITMILVPVDGPRAPVAERCISSEVLSCRSCDRLTPDYVHTYLYINGILDPGPQWQTPAPRGPSGYHGGPFCLAIAFLFLEGSSSAKGCFFLGLHVLRNIYDEEAPGHLN